MKIDQDNKSLKESVKQILDQDVAQMDDQIVEKLRHVRRKAMVEEDRLPLFHRRRFPLSLAGVMAGVLVVVSLILFGRSDTPNLTSNMAAEMDILLSEETLDFYEDLDFYAWLVEEDDHAG